MKTLLSILALVLVTAYASSQTRMFINKFNGTIDSLWLSEVKSVNFKTFATPAPTDSLVAYYPFNGNANDESGNGNNGIVHSATLTTDKFGQADKAYSFDGLSSYIEIPDASSLQPAYAMTVSVLVCPKGFYKGECQANNMISKGNDNVVGSYALRYDDNNGSGNDCFVVDTTRERFHFHILFSDGSDGDLYSTTRVQLNNTWYLVTGTYDGATMKLYVNGVLENMVYVGKSLGSNTANASMGRLFGNPGYDYWVTGVLDDLRIYSRALSEAEVQQLYLGGGH